MNFCRCEDEHHMGGGLFKRFQQSVERRIGEHVHFVDNIDPILPTKRRKLDVLANLANVVHAGVRGPVDLDHVHRRTLGDFLTIHTGVAGRPRRPLFAIERLRQNASDRRLPHAPRAGKQERMGNPLSPDGIHQRLDDVRLSNDIVEGSGPVFSCGDLIIHGAGSLFVNRNPVPHADASRMTHRRRHR
jgi:hypothetical protein